MSNFKYSANINGTKENKERFVQDLKLRGYKWREDFLEYQYPLCVNKVDNKNGFYRSGRTPDTRDYTFNIDTVQEYDTALAVLSMKNSELFYTGELVEILAAGGWGYSADNHGCIGIVLKTNKSGFNNNCIGATQNIVFKTLNPKEKDSYTDEADAPNLAYNKPVFRKLTELEVINFYKTQNVQEKKLIGYKIIKTYPSSIPLNTILYVREKFNKNDDFPYIDSSLTRTTTSITVGDLKDTEYFEPVYEQVKPTFKQYTLESGFEVTVHKSGEVMTNDGTFTIKELDTKFGICFRCTKFNKWGMVVTEAKYKIGCQVVTHKDIIGINELYKELNK